MKIIKAQNMACPICGSGFLADDKHFTCEQGHAFDIARQGYVNLLPVQHKRSKAPGDSKEMVVARTEFLNTGLYEPIAKKITELISETIEEGETIHLLDAGCGEGYYLDYIYTELPVIDKKSSISFTGLDISKPAIIASAKRNKDITWIVGTNRQPPLIEESVDIILCVFGFQSFEGFSRILKAGGKVLLVEAGPNHLIELKKLIYIDEKGVRDKVDSEYVKNEFSRVGVCSLQFTTGALNNEQINQILSMTPHLFRATRDGKESVNRLQELSLTADVVFTVFEKKRSSR